MSPPHDHITVFILKRCDIILNTDEKVCTKIPRGRRKHATFLLDTSCCNHHYDFKADNNGSFGHHGSKTEFNEMENDGEVSRISDPKDLKSGQYKLTQTYWVYSSTKALKEGQLHNNIMLVRCGLL